MTQLAGIDALMLSMETDRTPWHIGGLLVFKPKQLLSADEQFAQVRAGLECRMGRAALFRRKLKTLPLNYDLPYWVDAADFDLDDHVHRYRLPANADETMLNEQVSRIYSRRLDRSRPLWECWIIEGLDALPDYAEGSYGLLFKAHHAAIDGTSGAEIVAALCLPGEPAGTPWYVRRGPSTLECAQRGLSNGLARPGKLLAAGRKLFAKTSPVEAEIPDIEQPVAANEEQPSAMPWHQTPYGKRVGSGRNLSHLRMDLQAVKRVRKSVPHSTLNHVVLTVVGDAMRRYADAVGQPVEQLMNSVVPINIRDRSDETGGNRVSFMFSSLANDIEDPRERLIAVRDSAIAARAAAKERGKETFSELLDGLHPYAFSAGKGLLNGAALATGNIPTPIHTIVSNIPGPDMPLYMDGDELVDLRGLGLIAEPAGIFHAVVSYCGTLTISALSCPEVMESPALYKRCLEQAWQALYEAVVPTVTIRTEVKSPAPELTEEDRESAVRKVG